MGFRSRRGDPPHSSRVLASGRSRAAEATLSIRSSRSVGFRSRRGDPPHSSRVLASGRSRAAEATLSIRSSRSCSARHSSSASGVLSDALSAAALMAAIWAASSAAFSSSVCSARASSASGASRTGMRPWTRPHRCRRPRLGHRRKRSAPTARGPSCDPAPGRWRTLRSMTAASVAAPPRAVRPPRGYEPGRLGTGFPGRCGTRRAAATERAPARRRAARRSRPGTPRAWGIRPALRGCPP